MATLPQGFEVEQQRQPTQQAGLRLPDGFEIESTAITQQTQITIDSQQQGGQNGLLASGGLGVPSPDRVAIQEQQRQRLETIPELGQAGLLAGQDPIKGAAITPALLTTTNPRELGQILTSNFPDIGIQETKEGVIIATNNQTGVRAVLNQPGLSQLDIVQGLGIAAAFTPAGRAATTGALVARTAVTSGLNEAVQSLSGGEFNAEQVAIDAVTAGLLDKALEVAKATGRNIKDVLRKDAGVDPERILKTFTPGERVTSAFATKPTKPSEIGGVLEKVSQPGITPEALQRIRQAEKTRCSINKSTSIAAVWTG